MAKARKMETDEVRFDLSSDQRDDGRILLFNEEMLFTAMIDNEHGIECLLPTLREVAAAFFGKPLRDLQITDARPNGFSFAARVLEYA
jgi:hypothetical protein